ncbi:MAG: efflux RND transporter periplasmic adaptor subunit [Gammaproteobacteria bacterium]|nr:efflux RND transporter periplasmic adaptor subunit [Rhodocyclaceae bacterium]MBU3908140.1 efflux RND transporter periplasmic adaptor subunit [Gammaproteobacteria bacterium]MBU3989735.1 efflux RND transporter periplasmic adaptor subunit [Gammaproteobacteria bacterium]MBU4005781.1 efflux RND transporter periplasmic adaptor subunit [Gammaproteobacteria bacterium]MBU4021471.1 efflux RND transporter periplasmic adaptor subunit [Gammaproteobacteria bacterium]
MKFWWLLAIPLLVACGEKLPPPDAVVTGPKLVKALKVGAGGTAHEQRYSGEVRARIESTLGFRVGGKLAERLVDAGARVKAGQPLARLDPADAQLTFAQAEANRALAAAELQRSRELQTKNFISQAALDAKVTTAKAAAAQAQLAKNQAAYTTLVADAAGVVAAVLAEPGQVVAAGQGVFRIARDGEREVAVNIPESRITGLNIGTAATVTLWAGQNNAGGKAYRGRLRELAPVADPATRTFAARIAILDADIAVALGMTASVSFAQGNDAQIVVPLAAILQQGEQATVWVIGADATVSQRVVAIERYADSGAVLKSGLQPGEMIVAAGAFKLVAGEKIRIAEAGK